VNPAYVVEMDNLSKVFFTRHVFQKNAAGQRRIYEKKIVHAARNLEFGIQRGEIFGLLGPNGAGKTTAIKMVSGLVRPTAGRVYVDGLHVEKKRLQVLRKLGVVLEGTRTSLWPLTPLENLAYYGNLKDVRGKILRERSLELLNFFGLDDKMNVQVRKLSRGQKQKLAICIALIADPPVVLLDEPTTGLDVQSSRAIKDRIVDMTRLQGKSVLVTTHDMHVAQELCDRIGIINNGRLVACKPTEKLIGLFSDQVYEFRLDRLPANGDLGEIPGVQVLSAAMDEDEAIVTVRLEHDKQQRSDGLYTVMDRLRERQFLLLAVKPKQGNLEDVFLQITGEAAEAEGQ
jgi:ABC-2 type transport system ATP-binding protein